MSLAPRPGPQLPRAARAALPLFVGQGVVFAAAFLQRPALLFVLAPADFAAFGLLHETLRWAVVVGGLGLATGLLRMAPERPAQRGALLRAASLAVLVASLATLGALLLGRDWFVGGGAAADELGVFAWKVPCIALGVVCLHSLHAAGRLREKAAIDAADKVLVLGLAVGGAALDGLRGLVTGSLIASAGVALIALRVASRAAGPSERLSPGVLARTFAIGRAHLAFMLFETLRRLVVLRIVEARGSGPQETAQLYAAMALTLPLIALPEMVAQAVYPGMVTARGESADLAASHRGLFRELAVIVVPVLAVYGAAVSFALPLVRDGAYAAAVAPLLALLPGVAAHGLTAHTGYVVLARHRLPRAVGVSVISLATAAGLGWWWMGLLGVTGVAAALSVALILRGALLYRVANAPT